jgi:hypothetical protein
MKPIVSNLLAATLVWIAAAVAAEQPPAAGPRAASTPAASPAAGRTPRDFDLQGFIDARLQAGQRSVIVPPGRYRVQPKHGRHLSFHALAGVEVIADGVEMICTQTTRAMVFENCRNVRVKGLTIDYDPLAFTEARITALPPDKSWVEFEIIPGYPDDTLEERIEIFDPATGELRRTDSGWVKQFQPQGPRRYRIAKPPRYRYRPEWDTERVGDILVTTNRFPAGAGGHAIEASGCTGLKLEDVTLYTSPCFGFVEHACDGSTYLRCRIDRRPAADDLVKRGFPRMRSLTADAFHSVEARKGPAIIECTAKFQGDDCVNIHGSYHFVMAVDGNQLRVVTAGRMTISPGDPVEFLPFSGPRPPDAVAVQVEAGPPLSEAETAFFKKVSLNPSYKQRLLGGQSHGYKVMLDHDVSMPVGSAICSGNRSGNGFIVKGCDFGYNRSRGILIKASRGQVVDNRITHGWMAAVLVAPEYWWSESASSSDLIIAGNVITGCRGAAISVIAPGGDGKPLPAGAHRNISITGNTIAASAWPNIFVTSTTGLAIKDNRLTSPEPAAFTPPLARRWDWKGANPAAIVIEQCAQTVVP